MKSTEFKDGTAYAVHPHSSLRPWTDTIRGVFIGDHMTVTMRKKNEYDNKTVRVPKFRVEMKRECAAAYVAAKKTEASAYVTIGTGWTLLNQIIVEHAGEAAPIILPHGGDISPAVHAWLTKGAQQDLRWLTEATSTWEGQERHTAYTWDATDDKLARWAARFHGSDTKILAQRLGELVLRHVLSLGEDVTLSAEEVDSFITSQLPIIGVLRDIVGAAQVIGAVPRTLRDLVNDGLGGYGWQDRIQAVDPVTGDTIVWAEPRWLQHTWSWVEERQAARQTEQDTRAARMAIRTEHVARVRSALTRRLPEGVEVPQSITRLLTASVTNLSDENVATLEYVAKLALAGAPLPETEGVSTEAFETVLGVVDQLAAIVDVRGETIDLLRTTLEENDRLLIAAHEAKQTATEPVTITITVNGAGVTVHQD